MKLGNTQGTVFSEHESWIRLSAAVHCTGQGGGETPPQTRRASSRFQAAEQRPDGSPTEGPLAIILSNLVPRSVESKTNFFQKSAGDVTLVCVLDLICVKCETMSVTVFTLSYDKRGRQVCRKGEGLGWHRVEGFPFL